MQNNALKILNIYITNTIFDYLFNKKKNNLTKILLYKKGFKIFIKKNKKLIVYWAKNQYLIRIENLFILNY